MNFYINIPTHLPLDCVHNCMFINPLKKYIEHIIYLIYLKSKNKQFIILKRFKSNL